MDKTNHYERAFEAYLQDRRLSYVAVDESRRSLVADDRIKSLDFIVYGKSGIGLLIDIKGRRFPGGKPGRERRVWECWSTHADVTGLLRWGTQFGPAYQGVLVFAYQLAAHVVLPDDTDDLWTWRDVRYLFRAIAVADYKNAMRVRSPKWGTVTLPRQAFHGLVRPLHHFTGHGAGVSGQQSAATNQYLELLDVDAFAELPGD